MSDRIPLLSNPRLVTMPAKIYALLVGINDYPDNVGKLRGCVNDVDRVDDYLKTTFRANDPRIEILKDADATRQSEMEEARVGNADVFVAATGRDADNIVCGVEARELGSKRIMIDGCDSCGVVWLDVEELGAMCLLFARTELRGKLHDERLAKEREYDDAVFGANLVTGRTSRFINGQYVCEEEAWDLLFEHFD